MAIWLKSSVFQERYSLEKWGEVENYGKWYLKSMPPPFFFQNTVPGIELNIKIFL